VALAAKQTAKRFDCPVDGFQQMISGKYKLRILWNVGTGPRRYGELRRALANLGGTNTIAPRVLSRELKALTELGLLQRTEYRQVPPKVEYSLSPLGRSLLPVVTAMHQWGVQHLVRPEALRRMRAAAGRRTRSPAPENMPA
jgi:DNA-binding HxlR family transcriptional regulator